MELEEFCDQHTKQHFGDFDCSVIDEKGNRILYFREGSPIAEFKVYAAGIEAFDYRKKLWK